MNLKTESSTSKMIGNVSLTVMNLDLTVLCFVMPYSELENNAISPSMHCQVLRGNLSFHQASSMKQMLQRFGEVAGL